MEVTISTPQNLDFDFHGATLMKPVGEYYFSAPTSPDNLYQFYKDFDKFFQAAAAGDRSPSGLSAMGQFGREGNPGTMKFTDRDNNGDDFAFDVSQEWETASLSAEELFDGGVIKPLTPLTAALKHPRPGNSNGITAFAGKPTRKKIQGAGSPPPAALARTQRGRETAVNPSKPRAAAARSLSPQRDTEYPKGLKKWRLKDLFLFRSASAGRATEKHLLKKYTSTIRRSSFRAIEATGSGSRRTGVVSAHEVHYTVNRAISEDLKKKTFLPYKQGIVGRLAFNPAVHALANGFGFSRK